MLDKRARGGGRIDRFIFRLETRQVFHHATTARAEAMSPELQE
ncbi:MAG TPA: hypothetical protein VIW80_08295 [Pyrinomonadaceae bacterium]